MTALRRSGRNDVRTRLTALLACGALIGACTTSEGGERRDPPTPDGVVGDDDRVIGADGDLGGGGGDDDATGGGGEDGRDGPPDDVDAEEGTIEALQIAATDVECDPEGFTEVMTGASVEGAVVTSPIFTVVEGDGQDPALKGFFAADPGGGKWSGILVTFDAGTGPDVAVGDRVTLEGSVADAFCNTQLSLTNASVTGSGEPPEPTVVEADLGDWEPYEGVLVRVEGAQATSQSGDGFTEWWLSDTLRIGFDFDPALQLQDGATYDVTGPVNFAFGDFAVAPRSADDVTLVDEGGSDAVGGGPDVVDGSPGGEETVSDGIGPDPDGAGGATTIASLQQAATEVDCDPEGFVEVAAQASVEEAVVTSPSYTVVEGDGQDPALKGFFAADPGGGKWSGILVTFDDGSGPDVAVGDRVALQGSVTEAFCNTQLSLTGASVTGSGEAPPPVTLDPATDDLEPYEGVLARVEEAQPSQQMGGSDGSEFTTWWIADVLRIDFDFDPDVQLQEGLTYELTGPINFAFGDFAILPRTADDVVPADGGTTPDADGGAPPDGSGDASGGGDANAGDVGPEPDAGGGGEPKTIPEIQQSSASTDCSAEEPQTIQSGVTVTGTVAVSEWQISSNLRGYALTNGEGGPWSGVLLAVPEGMSEGWDVGTQLEVTGEHSEFFCMTEMVASSVEAVGTDATVPDPSAASDIADSPEKWEGVVVELSDVEVTANDAFVAGSSSDQENYVETDAGVRVDASILGEAMSKPEVGATWETVRGFVRYSFGAYRVAPRTTEDLVVAGGSGE